MADDAQKEATTEKTDQQEFPLMNAQRLELISRRLFGDTDQWKERVAKTLDLHVSTVRRWVQADAVPRVAELALEGMFIIKSNNWKQDDHGRPAD